MCLGLRVNSHNSHYLFFCTSRANSNVPCGNRTHNYSLGVQVRGVNPSQGMFILVKESLDFSNFPVILCQNKKIEIHLCKTLFGGKPVAMPP